MRRLSPLLLAVASALALSAAPAHALQPIEPLGSQLRLTQQGADGDFNRDTFAPEIAYNSKHNEFLIVWEDRTPTASQIFGRRLAAGGTPIGAAFQISGLGVDAGIHDARDPAVAYDFERDRYGVAYTHPQGSSGRELFLQLVS